MAPANENTPAVGEVPERLGRFTVLGKIGAGAMGAVYAAYDPVLDRRVALKLLHARGLDAARLRARLLREAQAMASISHENVIAIHDVGLLQKEPGGGEGGEEVFLAMEFVEGLTLSAWIAQRHSVREVLRVFALAGRGLSAAHAAGLVHRDFKPDNVLVGRDGRVRVTDFGLARSGAPDGEWQETAGGGSADAAGEGERAAAPGARQSTITQSALQGSPAYMAPEQMAGAPLDARADQFSFAVALYEALYGERPFSGVDLISLREAIERRRVHPEPPGRRLPARLRKTLLRALAAKPEDRFASLDELLDRIEPPAKKRARLKRVAIAATSLLGLVAAGALVALAPRWQKARRERLCEGAEEKIHAVWSDEARAKAKAAFEASGLAYASEAWELAGRALDRYAREWAAQRTEACEATAVKKTQSPELLDLRMGCLDDRLRELAAVLGAFAGADSATVDKSSRLTASLTPLSLCADEQALRAPAPPLPSQRERVAALEDRLEQLRLLSLADRPDLQAARQIAEEARKLDYPPLEAHALTALAVATGQSGDGAGALKLYPQAAAASLRAGLDRLVARNWTDALLIAVSRQEREEAAIAKAQAEAAVARMGNPPVPRGELLIALATYDGSILLDTAADARDAAEAVRLLDSAPSDAQRRMTALEELSQALIERDQLPEALAAQERAWKLSEETFGPDHPFTAEAEVELGDQLAHHGRGAEGRVRAEHGLQVLLRSAPHHPVVGDAWLNMADLDAKSDPVKAEREVRSALEIFTALPPGPALAYAKTMLANTLIGQGRLREAEQAAREAAALEQQLSGQPDDLQTAIVWLTLAEILWREDEVDDARALLEQALAAQRKAEAAGASASTEHDTLLLLTRDCLELGRAGEARRHLDELRALPRPSDAQVDDAQLLQLRLEQAEGKWRDTIAPLEALLESPDAGSSADESLDRDEIRFLLARALWTTRRDKPRALELANQARAAWLAQGPRAAKLALEAKRWLAEATASPKPPAAEDGGAPAAPSEAPPRPDASPD